MAGEGVRGGARGTVHSHAGRVRRFYQRRRSSQLDLLEWTVEARRSRAAARRGLEREEEREREGEGGEGGDIVTRRRVVTDPAFFWEGLRPRLRPSRGMRRVAASSIF